MERPGSLDVVEATKVGEESACFRTEIAAVPDVVVGVIVARLDSSRLPGKVLASVGDRRVLDLLLERATATRGVDRFILATTGRSVDDPLVRFAEEVGLEVYRGDTDDVARRVLEAAEGVDGTFIVRLNADSPFVDAPLLDKAIALARTGDFDLVTNLLPRTYPYGVTAEVLRRSALASAQPQLWWEDREHVTRFFYRQPERFNICNIRAPESVTTQARLVVDTKEDLARLRAVAAELDSDLVAAPVIEIVRTYESLAERGAS